jgi:hypothetical protein
MGNTAQSLAHPDAAREIVETCIALLNDTAGSTAT